MNVNYLYTELLDSILLYGFNGEENADEVAQGVYNLGARHYDARIGRMFSSDPKEKCYAWQSTYAYFSNSPVKTIDVKGEGGDDLNVGAKVTYNFGSKENSTGFSLTASYTYESTNISSEISFTEASTTMGTGNSSMRFGINLNISQGIGKENGSSSNPTGKSFSWNFGTTLYLNNDGTSQRTGNIGFSAGDWNVKFEDDFIPGIIPSIMQGKLANNPLLSDGRDRYNSAAVDVGYSDNNFNVNFGVLVITGEPAANNGNKPGMLGTALLTEAKNFDDCRVVMGQHKKLATGIAYSSFGLNNGISNNLFKPQLTLGYDSGKIQDGFQNGFHNFANMNLLEIVPNNERMQKEGVVVQFGNNFGYK